MKIKKLVVLMAAAALIFCSCSPADNGTEGVTILTADFAEYDWVREILGDNPSGISLERLNESGQDMHSYQPSVKDMVKISDCSLLVYAGGESEFWIDEAAESSDKSPESILSLMEILAHDSELSEKYKGTAGVHDHEHEHHHDEGEDEHDHYEEYDEHMWLSLKAAPVFIEKITEAICALDPVNSAYYEKNSRNYIEKINALDGEYEKVTAVAREKGEAFILVADRFPFIYLTEDYQLSHMAAFPGCSAETEASFATILDLSDAIDIHSPGGILVLKKSDTALAQTVIKNSSLKELPVLRLDDMQSVTADDVDAGCSYLSVMAENLTALETAFGIETDINK
ncbi:MAG: metal ABC transporter substrate-binding protein [Anaerovoracaceae bacterium]